MKKNNPFTVSDFIIFLKAKIAIIFFSTFLLSLIAGFFQVSYQDEWKIEVSRTVDNSLLIETISLIKKAEIATDIQNKRMIEPISVMVELNDLINSSMINLLSNDNIEYSGLTDFEDNKDLLKKEIYKLIIPNKDTKIIKENIIKYNLEKIFLDSNKLIADIIKIKYELEPTYDLVIYNFEVIEIVRVMGYNYVKIFKIVLINLIVSIFFIFIFHIRKNISLF
jgi:hypothetical protein